MSKKEKEFRKKYESEDFISEEQQRISETHKLPTEYLREVLNKGNKDKKKDKTKKPLKPIDPIHFKNEGSIITNQGISTGER